MIPIVKNTDPIGKSEIILLVKWKRTKKDRNYYHEECFPKQRVYSACLTLNGDILKSITVTKTI